MEGGNSSTTTTHESNNDDFLKSISEQKDTLLSALMNGTIDREEYTSQTRQIDNDIKV